MKRFRIISCLLVALPNIAFAEEPPSTPARPHEITAGIVTSFFINNRGDETPTAWALDTAYHYRPVKPGFWQALRFTGGLRLGLTNEAGGIAEVYGRGELVANVGPWTPTLGPELGVTSLGRHFTRIQPTLPDEHTALLESKLSPFYIALVATPLRFCFSRLTISAMELSAGAPITGISSISRFQLGILSIGGTL